MILDGGPGDCRDESGIEMTINFFMQIRVRKIFSNVICEVALVCSALGLLNKITTDVIFLIWACSDVF